MNRTQMQSPHTMLPPTSVEDGARELFWSAVTMYLEAEARPGLRTVYETRTRPALTQALGREPDRHEVAKAMHLEYETRFWYKLRTDAQREAIIATQNVLALKNPFLQERARALANGPGSLKLDPSLSIPAYAQAEFHLQPGGYHASSGEHDIAAGAAYDRGISVGRMGAQGWLNDDAGHSLASWVKGRFPDLKPKRILEMGCAVGHTLLPFKIAFPEAEVHGIDLSAPALRYAFSRAAALGVDAHFHQENAECVRFPDASFDIVFSRILMHETSIEAVPEILKESHRLLKPGGLSFHSDAPQFDELDTYSASLRDWDAKFNNEPFMDVYYDLPLEDLFEAAGFVRKEIFRGFTASLAVAERGVDPKYSRTNAGRYFYVGALKS